MIAMLTVLALAIPGGQPPCKTTCTGHERALMTRELAQLHARERRLNRWMHWARTIDPYRDWLGRLRWCESRNNWRIVNRFGYAGAYQFGGWAWAATGGIGLPQNAHPLEQSYRAVILRRRYGLSQWECKVGS